MFLLLMDDQKGDISPYPEYSTYGIFVIHLSKGNLEVTLIASFKIEV